MHIVLFDIDGTLIDTGGAGQEALRYAFVEVFQRPAPAQINTCGRTDRGIALAMFQSQALIDSPENWRVFHAAYLRHLTAQLPKRDGTILPGVSELLCELASRKHVSLGLLTGNTRDGARIKLEHFDLVQYFSFGGFGDRSTERNAVASEALQAARARFNGQVRPERVWVVGDTPLDIQCARHIGARAVAVATGLPEHDQLREENPDLLLDDLTQADRLLRRLDGVAS